MTVFLNRTFRLQKFVTDIFFFWRCMLGPMCARAAAAGLEWKKSPIFKIQISVEHEPQRSDGVHRQALYYMREINGWTRQMLYNDIFALNWYHPPPQSDFTPRSFAEWLKSVFCNRYMRFEFSKRIFHAYNKLPANLHVQIDADKKLQRRDDEIPLAVAAKGAQGGGKILLWRGLNVYIIYNMVCIEADIYR